MVFPDDGARPAVGVGQDALVVAYGAQMICGDDVRRRRYLGSGDSGPLMAWKRPELAASLAKYQTVGDVWLRIVHGVHQPSSPQMERGLREEPRLRTIYRETIGPCSEAPGVIAHPSLEWACGSPDSYLEDSGILELKTTVIWAKHLWGEPATDKIPNSYMTQVQWQLACSGRDWWRLLVAFGSDGVDENNQPIFSIHDQAIYQGERDDELCAELLGYGEEFWRSHVEARVAPGIPSLHNKRHWKRLQNERHPDELLKRLGQAG